MVFHVPKALEIMPSNSQQYVELSCTVGFETFIASIAFNIILLIMCTYYAVKTRKLPDNYNESRFVSFCVYTTLVMWLAFIPTYFTAAKTSFRTMFLSIAMLANSYVLLTFLYFPKLYALYFVSSDDQNVIATITNTTRLRFRSGSAQVAPSTGEVATTS